MLLMVVIFFGCGPQYKTFTTYVPPLDSSGKDCVQKCYDDKMACERQAIQQTQICQKEAQLQAKQEYLNAKEDYLNRLEAWNRMYLSCEQKKPHEGCKHIYDDRPREPLLSDLSKFYFCPDETDKCTSNYDMCFEMCGGQIFRETRCISNCK